MTTAESVAQTLSQLCPAFAQSCPYARALETKASTSEPASSTTSSESLLLNEISTCPPFREHRCAFKDDPAVLEVLRKQLELHRHASKNPSDGCPVFSSPQGCPFKDCSSDLLAQARLCPKFANGCPFKLMCSNGELLVAALRARRWDQLFGITGSVHESAKGAVGATTVSDGELANALKEGTKRVHALAERASFVTKFRKGEISREVYAQLLLRLYYVYRCMERLLEECSASHPTLATLHFPKQLNRTESLSRDLTFFLGEDWELHATPSPVVLSYRAALESCAKRNPIMLVAHAYTRYLGDLSGGQIIKRMAKKTLGLDVDEGTQFYCFENIDDGRHFKQLYRTRLDNLPLQPGEVDALVEEANLAFLLNVNIFQEILDEPLSELPTPTLSTLPVPAGHPAIAGAASGAQCPFLAQSKTNASSPKAVGGTCPVHNPNIMIPIGVLLFALLIFLFW
eukprot:CAMPEP_0177650974 /NCGR_PEP_ID=MMETSP0447-20121125/12259_1 /TAXON_ID=0 /ORGANISM="Stygamoeba regulata, Strain BSH-02190019" /LENGTH=456 /DNA_ID=CAMNT_0019153941 /DNA_START=53 /DNA_END=1423 /DNA_ORIENTATION=+